MRDRIAKPITALAVLRLTARLLSIASIVTILLFFVGEGFDPASVSLKEWVAFVFFPIGVVAGMVAGWRNEGLGGSVVLESLLAFYAYSYMLNGSFPQGSAFLVFAAPGLLFLAYALFARRRPD
jgi:hypothetical protein